MPIQASNNPLRSDSPEESLKLRQELKDWEKAFEASNGGRRASREDIKNHPEIGIFSTSPLTHLQVTNFSSVARKYKLYNKLRTSSPHHPSKSSPAAKQKPLRPAPASTTQTPQKHTKHSHYVHPYTLDPYDPPLSARKDSPSTFRISIGPTPQKDGRVLGIFDFLSPETDRTGTPSKNQGRPSLTSIAGNSLKTPSKKRRAQNDDDEANIPSSKRSKPSLPVTLFTPSAARRTTKAGATPSSHHTLVGLDDTPAFLKRHHSSAHPLSDDAGVSISWSPEINVRMRTKPVLKGLSQLVRGLRDMADQELDDEMELLREVEGDEAAPKKPNFAAKLRAATAKKEQDLDSASSVPTPFRDSHTAGPEQQQPLSFRKVQPSSESTEMPLGPDRAPDEGSGEDSTQPARGRDGKPLRVFKKRGQRRSTRMSKMRPSKAKWKPEPVWKEGDGIEGEKEVAKEVAKEVNVVLETQLSLPAPAANANADDGDDDDDMLKTDNEEFVNSCHSFSSASDSDEEDLFKSTSKNSKANTTTNKKTKSKMKMKNQTVPPYHHAAPSPLETTTVRKTTANTQQPNELKQKKKKKIAPTAHANFRALKIRGKGSAGGKGGKKYSKSRGRR